MFPYGSANCPLSFIFSTFQGETRVREQVVENFFNNVQQSLLKMFVAERLKAEFESD